MYHCLSLFSFIFGFSPLSTFFFFRELYTTPHLYVHVQTRARRHTKRDAHEQAVHIPTVLSQLCYHCCSDRTCDQHFSHHNKLYKYHSPNINGLLQISCICKRRVPLPCTLREGCWTFVYTQHIICIFLSSISPSSPPSLLSLREFGAF